MRPPRFPSLKHSSSSPFLFSFPEATCRFHPDPGVIVGGFP